MFTVENLSEIHIRKIERPGNVTLIATHLPSGEGIKVTAPTRSEAKAEAYKRLCQILNERK